MTARPEAGRQQRGKCELIGLALALLAFGPGFTVHAAPAAGGVPPRGSVTITARVDAVDCSGPCCCSYITARVGGITYGASYCRWFRPLRVGEVVSKTGRADANGWLR